MGVESGDAGDQVVRILLVDDVVDLRLLLRIVLSHSGDLEVVGEAGDGSDAVAQAAALQPDLVLLDIAMPVMDGLSALPRIREAAPSAKVVMLSAFQERALGAESLRLGAAGYLEKGLAPDKLVAELRRILSAD